MRITALPAMLCAALALLLCAGAGAAQAQPGPDFYGVNVQPMVKLQVVPPERWDAYVAQMAADGLRTARADALWAWAEPTKPSGGRHTYTWDPADRPSQSLDRIVLLLARHGVRLLPTLTTAPSWAGASGVAITPDHYGDFAAFAGAFAARYGAGGSFWAEHQDVAPLPTTDYEVWSEANSVNFWTHRPDPAEYARALGPLSAAIHQADPAGHVLASIGWQDFENYLGGLYAAGARGSFDAIGFHPYAPHVVAILDLVERLRRLLSANGDSALPIDVTETGQPRSSSGPGSARAGEGFVSDQARAATHSLTGDALARSDCGVEDYLLYANVGSESDAERDSEGFMGLYSVVDGQPNALGSAIRDASLRWRAAPESGLALCRGGTSRATSLLPLDLRLTHDSPTCVTGHTTYRGNPLESAQLSLRTADGRVSRYEVDAFGQGRVCIPDGPPIYAFDVRSEIAGVAASATFRCPVPTGACTLLEPAPGAAPPVLTALCSYTLTARVTRVSRRRASARARLVCRGGRPPAARVSVLVQRRGEHSRHRLRRVTLRGGRTLKFGLKVALHPGDRLVLLHAKDRRTGLPRLEARATATRRLGAV